MIDEGELLAGRYRLVAQVGTGAMSVVWKAHDEHLNRVVAIKQLLQPGGNEASTSEALINEARVEEANRRARREARITARLNHPHAIVVYDMIELARTPYLIMEYLPSESLSAVLAQRGPLPPAEVTRIGSQIASALAAAHESGIVHRDVKPGNVLLAEDGTAKITDFGISRAAWDCTVTATGVLLGTPAYLAPEVARGQQAGFPADVFALGSTLYAAVEGKPPFGVDDNPLALLYRIVNNEITPPTRSGPLTDVLSWLLQCDISRRPTMQQARDALAAAPTAPVVLTAAGTSGVSSATGTSGAAAGGTPEAPPSPASDSSVADSSVADSSTTDSSTTGSFVTAALPLPAGPAAAKVAQTGPGTAPQWSAAEGGSRSRQPMAVLTVAASLLVVGFMLVAALINHRNDTAGPPPGTAPSRIPPSSPGAAPPPGTSEVPPPGTSTTTPSPEPSREGERVANPDPSQVPDPELGPSPEPTPDPSPQPEDIPAPSPPSDSSGR
ncbi:MAG TPA: protein kinase [Pseudonocardiaceae bacterium]|nr:protein kinase [Pseudonocardiaceae bacterium]